MDQDLSPSAEEKLPYPVWSAAPLDIYINDNPLLSHRRLPFFVF